MKDHILMFLKNRAEKLCVFSTSTSEGKPESSVVGYAVKDDLTIIISTTVETRKWKNLKENKYASFVIGWSFSEKNIQMDGTAEIVSGGNEYNVLDSFFFTQNPSAIKFKNESTVFIKFSPSWIRYVDPTSNPSKIEELDL